MVLQGVRVLLILAMYLILFIFTSESLQMEKLNGLNGSAQAIVDYRQENLSRNMTFNQSDSSMIQTTECSDKFCFGNFSEPEHGNPVPALQKVRIRRASKAEVWDNFFPQDSWTSCRVPDGLRTAEIRCKLWPSSIKCVSYCVYGSTYDEGIQRVSTCKYKENKWSKPFDECKPFVDCRLKVVSPGNIRCIRNEMLKQPKCDVSCEVYEDKDPVKEQTYSCHASGKWSPSLPFCVQPRGETKLASAPKEIEHKELRFPV